MNTIRLLDHSGVTLLSYHRLYCSKQYIHQLCPTSWPATGKYYQKGLDQMDIVITEVSLKIQTVICLINDLLLNNYQDSQIRNALSMLMIDLLLYL